MELRDLMARHRGGRAVDWGCFGWRLQEECDQHGISLCGVDLVEPAGRSPRARFVAIEDAAAEIPDGYADLVFCIHVIEHMVDPGCLMQQLVRIARPGGALWIEAPSELSAMRVGSPDPTDHEFVSFWDDPTHIRPWTPGALYRLALSHRCLPQAVWRAETDGIPVVRMLAEKSPPIAHSGGDWRYVSLRGVAPGVESAWRSVWGEAADGWPLNGKTQRSP